MEPPQSIRPTHRDAQIGLGYGVAAYIWWGLIPIYFKLVAHIAPLSVLAHRVLWSFVFFALLLIARPQWREMRDVLRHRKTLLMLAASTVLLAGNWGAFIYAVSRNAVLQTSLGYFIVPLMSVALAVIVLKERLRRWQMISVMLAVIGVAVITFGRGMLPWISMVRAISWGGYSLMRKIAHVSPLVGVAIETAMLVPVAAAYLTIVGTSPSPITPGDYGVIALSGIVTGLPLLWFTAAARRLRLTTLGFLQYGAPIGQFLLAVFLYGEPFGQWNFIGFSFIWAALAVYTIDSLRAYRASIQSEAEVPAVAEI
ncbi:MAG: chloramphenicol-sensitive protein RarD [Phycisphaerales bacterium]|nr:chloramphenicol-sensitive protein RarD [Phycisphaerales bacterium]